MNTPDISIISTSYNRKRFIEQTILSVAQQRIDGLKIEHIIVDGGSTDGTIDLLKGFGEKITWISEPDKGQYDAANKGFRMAHGSIIGWLDADDIYLPGALKTVVEYFKRHPEKKWAYGRCRIIGENGREKSRGITAYKNLLSLRYSYAVLLCENYISQAATFFRRQVFDEVGFLDIRFELAADYEFWLRMGKRFSPGMINRSVACFRSHPGSVTGARYRDLFEEELRVTDLYTKNRLLLLAHRINRLKIIAAYSLLRRGK